MLPTPRGAIGLQHNRQNGARDGLARIERCQWPLPRAGIRKDGTVLRRAVEPFLENRELFVRASLRLSCPLAVAAAGGGLGEECGHPSRGFSPGERRSAHAAQHSKPNATSLGMLSVTGTKGDLILVKMKLTSYAISASWAASAAANDMDGKEDRPCRTKHTLLRAIS